MVALPMAHGVATGHQEESGPQAVSPPVDHAIRGMGYGLDKPVHAGAPQAMDKPP